MTTRLERDSMGEIPVPEHALYGAQTQRAIENFRFSPLRLPREFIRALGSIKGAAAAANSELCLIDGAVAEAIEEAAGQVERGVHDDQFEIDVFQSGSGTSTNMNANEVIAGLASRALCREVHPNDHVNLGQSSNDVIPTAISVSAVLTAKGELLPALAHLVTVIRGRAEGLRDVVKTGRTHAMDAMPLTLGQELGGWAAQLADCGQRIEGSIPRLSLLAQGGTAVGTGINTHPAFADRFCAHLGARTQQDFRPSEDYFRSLSSQDSAVELSGHLRTLSGALLKITGDLRWMNSGPIAGLSEIELPQLQPGSSIMPGKVNPVIPEAVAMAAVKVIGNDLTIATAGASGSFQLNVMLPLIAHSLLESLSLLAQACRHLADKAIAGFDVSLERIADLAARSSMLVTALTPLIGYDAAARVANRARAEQRSIREMAGLLTDVPPDELDRLLAPHRLTEGGLP